MALYLTGYEGNDKEFKPFKSKVVKDGKNTILTICNSTKNKDTGNFDVEGYYDIFVNGNYPCEKGDGFKFKIAKVTGLNFQVFDGKPQRTIYADISVVDYGSHCKQPATTFADVTAEQQEMPGDLPF